MCMRIARFVKRDDGAAMVELALLLPLVLLVLFGITEFGRGLSVYMCLNHATREGARLGALGASDADILQAIRASAPSLDPAQIRVTISPGENSRSTGSIVRVQVDYPFMVLVPVISNATGVTIPLSATLSMRVE